MDIDVDQIKSLGKLNKALIQLEEYEVYHVTTVYAP